MRKRSHLAKKARKRLKRLHLPEKEKRRLAKSEETQKQAVRRRRREREARRTRQAATTNIARSAMTFAESEFDGHGHNAGNFHDTTCTHCKAYHWPKESESTCCGKGKVVLEPVPPPPERMRPLYNIRLGNKYFIENIRAYNNMLALASLGCSEVRPSGFNPTFKIQGKLYHRMGYLLPPAKYITQLH